MPDRVDERAEMLAAIDEGIAQLEAGQTLSMKEVEQRLAKWLSRLSFPSGRLRTSRELPTGLRKTMKKLIWSMPENIQLLAGFLSSVRRATPLRVLENPGLTQKAW